VPVAKSGVLRWRCKRVRVWAVCQERGSAISDKVAGGTHKSAKVCCPDATS